MVLSRLIFITIQLLVCSTSLFAGDYHLLDMDYFGIKAAKFGCNRDPMVPQYDECSDWVGRVAADFRLSLFEYGYWNNEIHTEATDSQVKTVGWHWELGIRLHESVFLFHEHHSRHVMDDEPAPGMNNRFPVEDSYGLRLNFYINDTKRKGIFK